MRSSVRLQPDHARGLTDQSALHSVRATSPTDQSALHHEQRCKDLDSVPQILGLRDRGQIREGFAADIAIIDPNTVGETNSFEKPKSYAKGIPYVIVNGVLVIDKGEHTGAKPGVAIRGRAHAQAPHSF